MLPHHQSTESASVGTSIRIIRQICREEYAMRIRQNNSTIVKSACKFGRYKKKTYLCNELKQLQDMKKGLFTMALWCSIALGCYAQDTLFPQADLYDTGMMNTYINAYRETAGIRMQNYNYYSDLSVEAYNDGQWYDVIKYVNEALSTGYYCGMLYFIRGFAYESLGNLKAAKNDYKTSIKNNYRDAEIALRALKEKIKQRKRR